MLCLVALNWARNRPIWNLRPVSAVWIALELGAWKQRPNSTHRSGPCKHPQKLSEVRPSETCGIEALACLFVKRTEIETEQGDSPVAASLRRERPDRSGGAPMAAHKLGPLLFALSSLPQLIPLCVASAGRPSPGA
jgi:hypothetical protein